MYYRFCFRGRPVAIYKIKHGLEPRNSDWIRVVSKEAEFEATAPGRAPRHRGDPETGAGTVAIRGRPLSYTE